jgi:hypothetical protein
MRGKLSQEQQLAICAAYVQEQLTMVEVGERFDVSGPAVFKVLLKWNVRHRHAPYVRRRREAGRG